MATDHQKTIHELLRTAFENVEMAGRIAYLSNMFDTANLLQPLVQELERTSLSISRQRYECQLRDEVKR